MAEKRKICGRNIPFIPVSLLAIVLSVAAFSYSFVGVFPLLNRYTFDRFLCFRHIRNISDVFSVIKIDGIAMHEIDEGVYVTDGFTRCGISTYIAILESGKELEFKIPNGSFIITALGSIFMGEDKVVQGESTGARDWGNGSTIMKAGEKGAIVLICKPDLGWGQNHRVKYEVLAKSNIKGTDLSWQPFTPVQGLHNWSGQIKITVQIKDVKGEVRINDWFLEAPEENQDERSAGVHDHSPDWWFEDKEQGYVPTIEFHYGLGNFYRSQDVIGYMVEYEKIGEDYREKNRIAMYYGSTHPLFCKFLPNGSLKYPPHAWITTSKDNDVPSFWGVVEVSAKLWEEEEVK